MDIAKNASTPLYKAEILMYASKLITQVCIFFLLIVISSSNTIGQCDPSSIDLCFVGSNSIVQATYHGQIIKTSNGYSMTGQSLNSNGNNDQGQLTQIPSLIYPMPNDVVPVWGAIGGRTQAVFIGSDNIIYAVGEEDLLIDRTHTPDNDWGPTTLDLPSEVTVCDINKWEGTAGSGDDGGNATGSEDGFLAFSTKNGALYITGDGASRVYGAASNVGFTRVLLPNDITVVNFAVGYRTLLIQGSDCNLYVSGSNTYLGNGNFSTINLPTLLSVQPPISIDGIKQIEAGFNSYLILDGDGTIHVLGENTEGSLGVGNTNDQLFWTKVGNACTGVAFTGVEKISTLSTHDYRSASSAIMDDGSVRSWGINHRNSITSGNDRTITCPIRPIGENENAVAISNGGHISPYVNSTVKICNIGHNQDGAFGDGNSNGGNYEEYECFVIPGNPEVCGTNEGDVIEIVPVFNQLGPYCINDIPDILSTMSDDVPPFSGMWVTDVINTSTVGVTRYTFIPDPGQCITLDTATMDIEITATIIPTFIPFDTICLNEDEITLPAVSDNDPPIGGTWSPNIINTSIEGWNTYTFIPDIDCAESSTLEIFVKDCECQNPTTVQIQLIASICAGEAIELIATIGGSATSMTWLSSGTGTILDPTNLSTSYIPSMDDILNGNILFTAMTNDPDGLTEPCIAAVSTMGVSITPTPLPPIVSDAIYCQGFNSTALIAIGENITWLDSDGNLLTDAPVPSTNELGVISYQVYQVIDGCPSDTVIAEVTITEFPDAEAGPSLQLGCNQDPVTLQGFVATDPSEISMLWSGPGIISGGTSINPDVKEPGTYTLTVTNILTNCTSKDSVEVTQDDPTLDFEVIVVNPLCSDLIEGEIYIENITGGESPYEISINGEIQDGNEITGLEVGSYNISITDINGCNTETSAQIINQENWLLSVTTNEIPIDKGENIDLNATLINLDSVDIDFIQWEPSLDLSCSDCLSTVASPNQTTIYTVTVADTNGCIQTREATIFVNPSIYFPNIISINNPANNTFYPMGTIDESIEVLELSIFDRWGNLIFFNESFMINDPSSGWDGTMGGNDLEIGVYVYYAKIRTGIDREVMFWGDVTLLR